MSKVLLVDGNSLFFRAYFASAYGHKMSTSSGIYTNAVFTFSKMFFNALADLKPDKVVVAFDSGKKSTRVEYCPEYKAHRKELDPELIMQFPIVRELLDAAKIMNCHIDGIEADDIIGTFSKKFADDEVIILTSDKDLLQLISDNTTVYLTKSGTSNLVKMDHQALADLWSITPEQVIDLKGLMGDNSDNIPGVKGVGEKTAIKLLNQYHSLEGIYEHINDIKGKLKEKLINDKELAFISKKLATIITNCELDYTADQLILDIDNNSLNKFYTKYEMSSLISSVVQDININVNITKDLELDLSQTFAIALDHNNNEIYGISFAQNENTFYLLWSDFVNSSFLKKVFNSKTLKYVYDLKTIMHLLSSHKLSFNNIDDLMLIANLVDNSITNYEDLINSNGLALPYKKKDLYGTEKKPKLADINIRAEYYQFMSSCVFLLFNKYLKLLNSEKMLDLYNNIELPLTYVLYDMEKTGIKVDLSILQALEKENLEKINDLREQIYAYAFCKFNINSPKQLAEVLFDELKIKATKKRSTNQEELEKLLNDHPIIDLILEYRKYQKLYSTYAVGLQKYIKDDNKIHTNYQQAVAQTGRLSSIEPNLQNISVRDENTRKIRKAFVADNDYLLSLDYSQVELRILASMANDNTMIETFKQDLDIHTSTAMSIFNKSVSNINSLDRRMAKAVNFGIVYGISDFGLAKQLHISVSEAKSFIEDYLKTYPNIKKYMSETIEYCQKNNYVKTLCNRKRHIPEINNSNYMMREFGKRAAMNAPIQGSAADLIKIAMINVYNKINENSLKSKMILTVHDELIFDVVEEELDQLIALAKYEMEHALSLKVPLKVEYSYAKDWYGAK
ncbi:MAG: DNA polymerase I [Erysipelotrichaceae bacterium]